MSDYTIDYYIKKFEAIPDIDWTINLLSDWDYRRETFRHCALGHCKVQPGELTLEGEALTKLFAKYDMSVTLINDGNFYAFCGMYKTHKIKLSKCTDPDHNPRTNVLNALYWIRDQEITKSIDAVLNKIPHQNLIPEIEQTLVTV